MAQVRPPSSLNASYDNRAFKGYSEGEGNPNVTNSFELGQLQQESNGAKPAPQYSPPARDTQP